MSNKVKLLARLEKSYYKVEDVCIPEDFTIKLGDCVRYDYTDFEVIRVVHDIEDNTTYFYCKEDDLK